MAFVKNAWYVAAWADEVVGGALFHRRILDQPILIYRQDNGDPVALADRCPHRFVPLHLGKQHGNVIECAYHGLRFDSSGACVQNPCGGVIPKAARVNAFPLVERDQLLYIWMGDPARADPSLIPDFGFMNDAAWVSTKGYIHGKSSYLLMVDNILDLTHTQFLHADSLGSEALMKVKTELVDTPGYLELRRWMPDDFQAPLSAASRGFAGRRADTWLDTRWYPAGNMIIEMGMTEPGAPRSEGKVAYSLHLVTPETEFTNHYYWAMARSYDIEDQAMTKRIGEGFAKAFLTEDKPILEAQQRAMGDADFWELTPVLLAGDAGGVRARRRIDAMLKQEAAA